MSMTRGRLRAVPAVGELEADPQHRAHRFDAGVPWEVGPQGQTDGLETSLNDGSLPRVACTHTRAGGRLPVGFASAPGARAVSGALLSLRVAQAEAKSPCR